MMGDGSSNDRGGDPVSALDIFAGLVPERGDYPCNGETAPNVKCTARAALPGICDDCDRRLAREAHEAVMQTARKSVPPRFRWARVGAPEWTSRVSPKCRAKVESLKGRLPKTGLTIIGQSGEGKTSAACAILNQIHDSATFDAPARVVERARRAFFVSAPQLESDFAESARMRWEADGPPTSIRLARSASVLLLDDLGQGRKNSEVARLVQERHDHELTTIITTFMTREQAAACYGDGFARRVYEWEIQCR